MRKPHSPEPMDGRSDLDDELALHLEERIRGYVAAGMDPEAARAAALERLGDLDAVRRACEREVLVGRRAEARRRRVRFSWLDFKLGLRMLARYPGLTVVGGLAIAFAIAVGAAFFEFVAQFVYPSLPFEGGDRVVAVRNFDLEAGRAEPGALHDLLRWRGELRLIDDLGGYRALDRNLIVDGGLGEPVSVAEISASGFRVTPVPPLLGRTLVEADEQPGAPSVVVIGYDVWRSRFESDPDVLGRSVFLGTERSTVVGVMPEGYAFPYSQDAWMPLRLTETAYGPREGPTLSRIFGRLVPGATLSEAQAELTAVGLRAAADSPATHRLLRPRVTPYARWLDMSTPLSVAVLSSNLLLVLFLVLVCVNVALLMFARAATREGEMVVRSALGATRGRIIGQLFVEALVLGGGSAVVGLVAASFVLTWGLGALSGIEGEAPFWFRRSLSLTTVLYGAGLAVVGASVAGILPAFKITDRGINARLQQTATGRSAPRFGGLWTGVVITQVAVTVAVPVHAYYVMRQGAIVRSQEIRFPIDEYLSARLELDRPTGADDSEGSAREHAARFRGAVQEIRRRIDAESGFLAVALADRLAGLDAPTRRIELNGGRSAPFDSLFHRVGVISIDRGYFDVLGTSILAGRGFTSADGESPGRPAVVNESFAREVLGGRNPIGQRMRFADTGSAGSATDPTGDGPWFEILGVVADLTATGGGAPADGPRLYQLGATGSVQPLYMAVRVGGEPVAFAQNLRELVASVDPGLRLHDLQPLRTARQAGLEWLDFLFWITVLVSGVALLLSLAGIYAVTSFAVSRRTREIGVRAALGGEPKRVLAAVLRRPLIQLGAGVALGSLLAVGLASLEVRELNGAALSARDIVVLVLYAAAMLLVCLVACVVPARRALGVEPTEALRAEA